MTTFISNLRRLETTTYFSSLVDRDITTMVMMLVINPNTAIIKRLTAENMISRSLKGGL